MKTTRKISNTLATTLLIVASSVIGTAYAANGAYVSADCTNGTIDIDRATLCVIQASKTPGATADVTGQVAEGVAGLSVVSNVAPVSAGPQSEANLHFSRTVNVERAYTISGSLTAGQGGRYEVVIHVGDTIYTMTNTNGVVLPVGALVIAQPGQQVTVKSKVISPAGSMGTASANIFLTQMN